MLDMSLLKELKIDDLSENHSEIAIACGMETLLEMCKHFGGGQVYIPTLNELIRSYVYKKVLFEYDGKNRKSLAVKYGISERTVYRLIKSSISAKV